MTEFAHRSNGFIPLELEREIDKLCDEFEQALEAGAQPRIEDYLQRITTAGRDELLRELIHAEQEIQRNRTNSALWDEHEKQFPSDEKIATAGFGSGSSQKAEMETRRFSAAAESPSLDSRNFTLNSSDSDNGVAPIPPRIDRFAIRSRLGGGAFGDVYLAYDSELNILVALKVPKKEYLSSSEMVDRFLDEARMAIRLNHPGIVRVYNVIRELGTVVIVLEYVEGETLTSFVKSTPQSPEQIADLMIEIAEAVNYANHKGLTHRDLKPDNILINSSGQPRVTDFGLAIHEDVQHLRKGECAGSPPYMAPEQVKRESHRVDGRTDQWSLGVILYELLTGRRPFTGSTRSEMFVEIEQHDPKPLRQIDASIPSELERICLKSLSKRMSDRYRTVADFADDLRHWRETGAGSADVLPVPQKAIEGELRVVPRGLRSFDENDSNFFLELLPGPRDRDGIPEGVRFWKTRVEERDADRTFSVGLIYGPSGCGKSSLVKAGLLPRLTKNVTAVYVEATPEDTEVRLLKGLRKHFPDLPQDLPLPDVLKSLREGSWLAKGKKLLIVLDQFEQWLHARQGESKSQLVDALRQCDGSRVQCIVMVRDDFWLAVSRFMHDLEIRIVEGQNSTLVDLFDIDHATKVLTAFGQAYGRLPKNPGDINSLQKEFLRQSVTGLARDGKVICVRLALFAEMMKGNTWTPDALKNAGGTEGIGVAFLEGTFSSSTAPPQHRYHQKAARALLEALLPDFGTEIKGQMKSRDELLEASGYANRRKDFDELLEILNSDIRLITPTDPDGLEADESDSIVQAGQKYYQLTHDYLVAPLRTWLTRKQTETMRGRAQLRLNERAAAWRAHPENRSLPALWEWAYFLLLTRRADRIQREDCRTMLRKANRFQLTRFIVTAAVLCLAGWWVYDRNGRLQAQNIVEKLVSADTQEVPEIVNAIGPLRKWANPLLAAAHEQSPHLHFAMALLPADRDQQETVITGLLQCKPLSFSAICQTLAEYGDPAAVRERLRGEFENDNGDPDRQFRAGIALLQFPPADSAQPWGNSVAFMADHLVMDISTNPTYFDAWTTALKPARDRLYPELERIFSDPSQSEGDRQAAALILADYEADDPEALVDLLLGATPRQYAILLPILENHTDAAAAILRSKLDFQQPKLYAHASALLLDLIGDAEPMREALSTTEVPAPFPDLCTYLEDRVSRVVANPEKLSAELNGQPNGPYRAALVRILGGMPAEKLSRKQHAQLLAKFAELFQSDSESAVHSAAEWALRSWKEDDLLSQITEKSTTNGPLDWRDWYISPEGHTMVIRGPAISHMGPGENEDERGQEEAQIQIRIERQFAIATKEVTKEQFLRFNPDFQHKKNSRAPDLTCPINAILWVDAVEYCRWLCKEEKIPIREWCYPPDLTIEFGMTLPDDYLSRTGYRLPTEAEWEYFCRANTRTRYCCGDAADLLSTYAWFEDNSRETHPVGSLKPNNFGMFDMHGNVKEWCHDLWPQEKHQDVADLNPLLRTALNVTRGGAFSSQAHDLRSANRRGDSPNGIPGTSAGFRVARTIRN